MNLLNFPMKYPLSICIVVLLIVSCSKKEDKQISSYFKTHYYKNNSSIIDNSIGDMPRLLYSVLDTGNKTVFEYRLEADNVIYNGHGYPYYAVIRFEADSDVNSINYADSGLAEHMCYYYSRALQPVYWGALIYKGNINGQKLNDGTWKIELNITLWQTDNYLHKSSFADTAIYTEVNELKY